MNQLSDASSKTGFPTPTPEQIAVAAFHLYMENGFRDGHDLDDWLKAENLLTTKLMSLGKDQIPVSHIEAASVPIGEQDETKLVAAAQLLESDFVDRPEIRGKSIARTVSRQSKSRKERRVLVEQMA